MISVSMVSEKGFAVHIGEHQRILYRSRRQSRERVPADPSSGDPSGLASAAVSFGIRGNIRFSAAGFRIFRTSGFVRFAAARSLRRRLFRQGNLLRSSIRIPPKWKRLAARTASACRLQSRRRNRQENRLSGCDYRNGKRVGDHAGGDHVVIAGLCSVHHAGRGFHRQLATRPFSPIRERQGRRARCSLATNTS